MVENQLYELAAQINDAFYNDEDFRNNIKGQLNEVFINQNHFGWEYKEWLELNLFTELKKLHEMRNWTIMGNRALETMYKTDYIHCMACLIANYPEIYHEWDKIPKDGMRKAIEGDEEE